MNDTILSSAGANNLDGGAGSDTVSYAASNLAVLINLAGQITSDGLALDTLSSIENATGSAFADTIVSSDGANSIHGGGGIDTVSYSVASRAMLINLASGGATDGVFTDTLISIENAIGSAFADRIGCGVGRERAPGPRWQ